MCIFHYFNYYLPDFVTAVCLVFIFGFSFLHICFNLTLCHNNPLVESLFLTRGQALSLWSGSTDSKTLDYQRTNHAAAKSLQSCLTLCDPIDSRDSPGKNTGVGCHFLLQCMKVKSESEVAQSCPTLCDPMDCSLPGSSIHGIFQARVLEWGAIAFSKRTNHREYQIVKTHTMETS